MELDKIDQMMDAAFTKGDLDNLTILNQVFHRLLYCLNPNQTVMPLIESVWLQLGPFQRQVLKNVESYYVADHHKEILTALNNRDNDALISAIELDVMDGIVHSGRSLLQKLNSDNS